MRCSLAPPRASGRITLLARAFPLGDNDDEMRAMFRKAVATAIKKQSLRQLSAKMQVFNEAAANVDETDLNIIDEI